jgi:putative addiction module component (TIGR02574 family)
LFTQSNNALYYLEKRSIFAFQFKRLARMTIEVLKAETTKLSKLEKLEFLQFLAEILSEEERSITLTQAQEKILLRRRDEVVSGKVQTIPAKKVKAKLVDKYGLQS